MLDARLFELQRLAGFTQLVDDLIPISYTFSDRNLTNAKHIERIRLHVEQANQRYVLTILSFGLHVAESGMCSKKKSKQ